LQTVGVKRWLEQVLDEPVWGPKMRFVARPRQCGKTTLARTILERPVVQLVSEHGVLKARGRNVVSVSASRFLS
jgi:predicted AAA+ superfamily ATPase